MAYKSGYKQFIEDNLMIVDKSGKEVDFILNSIQNHYLNEGSGRDCILKARQQGFSSLILAIFTADFILKPHSRSVIVADDSDNAIELLDRVKYYIQSWEYKNKQKLPLKYNSKYELVNSLTGARYTIGTSKKVEFGRSKTISNLHLSEAAFYDLFDKLLAGALQAVVPKGRAIIETTANGFNPFKEFWTRSEMNETGFKPMFFPASAFYDDEFLNKKRQELGRLNLQEYPETPIEAFVASGETFFNKLALKKYLEEVQSVKTI